MNKKELVAAVAAKAELSQKDAAKAVDALISAIEEELKKGEKVQLVGFGTFEVSERAATEIKIDAAKAPKFKAGRAFKDAIQ